MESRTTKTLKASAGHAMAVLATLLAANVVTAPASAMLEQDLYDLSGLYDDCHDGDPVETVECAVADARAAAEKIIDEVDPVAYGRCLTSLPGSCVIHVGAGDHRLACTPWLTVPAFGSAIVCVWVP